MRANDIMIFQYDWATSTSKRTTTTKSNKCDENILFYAFLPYLHALAHAQTIAKKNKTECFPIVWGKFCPAPHYSIKLPIKTFISHKLVYSMCLSRILSLSCIPISCCFCTAFVMIGCCGPCRLRLLHWHKAKCAHTVSSWGYFLRMVVYCILLSLA